MSGRREEILDAALALADERGLDAVSMRAVAGRTGVTPMALYPHVGSKTALLDGMVGRLLSGLAPPDAAAGPGWRQRLRALAHAARDLARRHPWAAALLFSRPAVTPDAAGLVDQIYLALLEAGVPAAQVPRLERLVSTTILGFAASEAGGRFGAAPQPRAQRGDWPGHELPGHQRLASYLELPVDWDAEFEADLADLTSLVEAAAAGSAQPGPNANSG
ncbi:MAG TPA: TetR/AcrR family transcriptional regulator [Streptosporangiaceae bacterium]|jgi:AcrR family transcriptional regulator